MVSIHISGTPGSGKSTLGIKLQKMFPNFKVVETDKFVTNANREERNKYKNMKDKKKIIFDIYKKKFNYYEKKYKNIIYVGILDSSVPDGSLYINKDFDHKIFLNISDIELFKRYYTREVKNGILSSDKYIKDAIDGKWYILSSKEVLSWHKKHIVEHKKLGYKLMTEKQIILFLSKL